MRVTIKGQVTIPREIRDKLGIMPYTEVDFVENPGVRHSGRHVIQDGGIGRGKSRLVIDHQQHPVGILQCLPGALHPGLFHRVITVMQSGRIDDVQRDTVKLDMLAQYIAGRTGDIGDYGSRVTRQRIQQAGLAGIRPPGNHQCHPVTQ